MRNRHFREMRHCLEFDDHFAGNQQINPLPFDNMPFVFDAHFDLSLKRSLSELQFYA